VRDSLGVVEVPAQALWGAQTQRAVENFKLSGLRLPRAFIQALGFIKASAAEANQQLQLLDAARARAISKASMEVAAGRYDAQFPVDVFQTGSGTSSNMNANEVIASLAAELIDCPVHPNDHVNLGQSSNDVIPTAIHVAAVLQLHAVLLPGLTALEQCIQKRAVELRRNLKTGRTHLMDAMPLSLGQELSAWRQQITHCRQRLLATLPRMLRLAQGGTAVGTGVNTHRDFPRVFCQALSRRTGFKFRPSRNFFESLATADTPAELSAQLKVTAGALTKISNDLRWMNSGPKAGLHEIELPALQPGSSIMPGKVNPVIPEAVLMACAQVIGNDATITVAAQSGNFQLNVMQPVVAYNLLQSIDLLANSAQALVQPMASFVVMQAHMDEHLAKNPILVTGLNPIIGYDKGARIAKQAYAQNRPVIEVAREQTTLSEEQLRTLLNPLNLISNKSRP